jgi:ABC-type sugar transport system permease subunit
MLFVLPWLLGFFVLEAWPLGRTLLMGFQDFQELNFAESEWIGLDNYRRMFTVDEQFLPVLWQTFRSTVTNVPFILVFSMLAALLVHQPLRGVGFFRTALFLPVVIGSVQVIQELLNQGVGGLVLFRGFNADVAFWTLFGEQTPGVLAFMNNGVLVLWMSGVQILIFLAGLNSISPTMYEAARVDGASGWSVFWKITLPMLSPVILINAIYSIVDSFTNINNSAMNYVLSVGLSQQMDLSYAAAMATVYLLMVFLLLLGLYVWLNRYAFYVGER